MLDAAGSEGVLSSQLLEEPDEVGNDLLALWHEVRTSMHEHAGTEIGGGETFRLHGGHEGILQGPDVQAREVLLGLVLTERVARNLVGERQKGNSGTREAERRRLD